MAGAAAVFAMPVQAQTGEPAGTSVAKPVNAGRATIYEPDYFTRFAPRNALDMVVEIPGFSISSSNNSRGLGEATQNVLINGQRLTSKSSSTADQLGRIPAKNVVRIEIVDGTTLGIPGLTGQVANIFTQSTGITGQFRWTGELRTKGTDPEWYGGEISAAGSSGALDYTLALSNSNNRFGSRGPSVITGPDGAIIENRFGGTVGAFDVPRIDATAAYDFGGGVRANLNATFARSFYNEQGDEIRVRSGRPVVNRAINDTGGSPEYEIGGDIMFPLGAGKLKLIALEAYDAEVADNILIDTPEGGIATGSRFTRDGGDGERIGRFEYSWAMLGGDWQWSGEAAFNRLDLTQRLFSLSPDGSFIEQNFTGGTGGVRESRYQTLLSYKRKLTPKLAFQLTGGGEISTIRLTGANANSRTFQRPKGLMSLAWQPEKGLDISLAVERKVGQLSFQDFLGRVFLDIGNTNRANGELVPDQLWDLSLKANKTLGVWGSTSFTLTQRYVEDYIDLIPLESGGEAQGNIDKARRLRLEWNSTIKLDRLGIPGAQLDAELMWTDTELRDPVGGFLRNFSSDRDRRIELDFRHDIPRSDWAYGGGYTYERRAPYFRLSEIGRSFDGPTFVSAFVEHKDIRGLTVNATIANINGGRERFIRTVFTGPRTGGIVRFAEDRNREIGPIFRLNVSGNF